MRRGLRVGKKENLEFHNTMKLQGKLGGRKFLCRSSVTFSFVWHRAANFKKSLGEGLLYILRGFGL